MARQDTSVPAMAQMFRILSDETRLRVLMTLQEHGELNVSELCKRLQVPQPTVSHHLGILRMGELVVNRRNGKEIFYSLNDLKDHKYARAVKSFVKPGRAIQFGTVMLGMSEG